jgi:YesN/AraC family two-component response regulator
MEKPHAVHFAVTLPLDKTQLNHALIIENTQIGAKKLTSDREDTNKEKQDQQLAQDLPLVLIVEDHKDVRDFLRSAWKEKYAVSEAKNGVEGIEKALKIVPDLILTDVRMPICTGIELCNALKKDERTSHIPIILLTSSTETENELKGLESGADDYISKPFKLPVLEKRIDNLIQIRKGLRFKYAQEYVLKAKDIAITPTDEVFLTKVQAILDEHLSDSEFNATAFHQKVGMSRMQLHRKLQTYTGLSTTEFIRSQRLKQAVLILKTSDATINEVAYAVGFSTPSYFIKCFKETYNNTPQEYAKSID